MYQDQGRGMVEGRGLGKEGEVERERGGKEKERGRGGGGRVQEEAAYVLIHKTGVENSNLACNDKPVCQPVSISLLPSLLPSFLPFLPPSLDLCPPSGQPPVQQGRTR